VPLLPADSFASCLPVCHHCVDTLLRRELVPLREGSAVTGEYVVDGLTPLTGLRVGIYRPVSGLDGSTSDSANFTALC
jgi:hypothetical protein